MTSGGEKPNTAYVKLAPTLLDAFRAGFRAGVLLCGQRLVGQAGDLYPEPAEQTVRDLFDAWIDPRRPVG